MKRSKSVELFLALGLSATLFACEGGTTNGEGGEQENPSSEVSSPIDDDGGEGGEGDEEEEDKSQEGGEDEGGEGGEGDDD